MVYATQTNRQEILTIVYKTPTDLALWRQRVLVDYLCLTYATNEL